MNRAVFKIPPFYEATYWDGQLEIRSNSKHKDGRLLTPFKRNGYIYYKMNNCAVPAHQIVASHFHGDRPPGLTVNHKDGNKTNNRFQNLEYVTRSENTLHAISSGLHVCCTPERIHTYIDGRCKNKKAYQAAWYAANRERLLTKAKANYMKKKAA